MATQITKPRTAPRKGDWMQTMSGVAFWPLDPCPDEVRIHDIAHALSHQCRYAGHCHWFYSVAQHSVLVSHAVEPRHALWGLLHDASEAYLVDVPRPIKPFLSEYKRIEAGVMKAVCDAFKLPYQMPAQVKQVDDAILADEAATLMSEPPRNWHLPHPPLGIAITPWRPEVARHRFLQRFDELTR